MITIFVYGLDQFVVGDLSSELTSLLAKSYNVSEDEINFVAPNTLTFHKGAEQTSWNVLVNVQLPSALKANEDKAQKILIEIIKGVAIHITVNFQYYDEASCYSFVNEAYPRYMEETESDEYDNYESEPIEEGDSEDQIYTGDIFEEIAKKKN